MIVMREIMNAKQTQVHPWKSRDGCGGLVQSRIRRVRKQLRSSAHRDGDLRKARDGITENCQAAGEKIYWALCRISLRSFVYIMQAVAAESRYRKRHDEASSASPLQPAKLQESRHLHWQLY